MSEDYYKKCLIPTFIKYMHVYEIILGLIKIYSYQIAIRFLQNLIASQIEAIASLTKLSITVATPSNKHFNY